MDAFAARAHASGLGDADRRKTGLSPLALALAFIRSWRNASQLRKHMGKMEEGGIENRARCRYDVIQIATADTLPNVASAVEVM